MPQEETHPYNLEEIGRIPEGTRLLIIGTAPPPRFSNPNLGGMRGADFNFFYGSEDNYMWQFLDEIAERLDGRNLFEASFSPERCCEVAPEFLKRHGIWMHDVLQTYQRKKGREDKAGDDDIEPPPAAKFTSFRKALSMKSISKLVFTSERAAEWTILALVQEGLLTNLEQRMAALLLWQRIDKALPIQEYLQKKFKQPFLQANIEARDFTFFILPSPSANARSAVYGLTLCRKQNVYESVLFRS